MKRKGHKEQTIEELKENVKRLEKEIEEARALQRKIKERLTVREFEFERARSNVFLRFLQPKNIKKLVRTTGSYMLLRRNPKRLYNRTYKQKQALNDIKKYTNALYHEGFTNRAIEDMKKLFKEPPNRYVKRAVSWELALWYANKQTKEGALLALPYIEIVKEGKQTRDFSRRIAIIEAECLLRIDKRAKATEILHAQLQEEVHPDIYLALANTEETIEQKQYWINQVYAYYDYEPIYFSSEEADVTYDDIRTKRVEQKMSEQKISVILPAYNAEEGIQTAIASILTQSWQNLELIIVDDCSTDKTMEVIQSYAKKDSRITVYSTPQNSGPYVARNIGLQHATGEFVTINDSDDWSHPEKLAVQARHLMQHPEAIANTSEQARLTEDLYFYRRGTPGKYIFSNMSSLMFRREQVVEKIGYWDTVRFAADGEFKRRLQFVFGNDAVCDLTTGPLSLPRQSNQSLTASSAFGYDGFFMGARKEYVESFTHYHQHAKSVYYPAEQVERLFPVPEPMLPERKMSERHIDVVMVADFYRIDVSDIARLKEEIMANKRRGRKTGLVQLSYYALDNKRKQIHPEIRMLIDGKYVQMLVYGEKIRCNVMIIRSLGCLYEQQKFVPTIRTKSTLVLIDESSKITYNGKKSSTYRLRHSARLLMRLFDQRGRWYPLNEKVRRALSEQVPHELKSITLAKENWCKELKTHQENYEQKIAPWFFD